MTERQKILDSIYHTLLWIQGGIFLIVGILLAKG